MKVYVNGYFKGNCDDEEKIRRMEERAAWNGRPVYRNERYISVGKRR